MKPHKHAELIKAWADGAEIEWKCKLTNNWLRFDEQDHFWDEEHEYRIKPEPKPDIVQYLRVWNGNWREVPEDYSREANLKLTFDSETGAPKSAEVLS